jgi:hypothetical protein
MDRQNQAQDGTIQGPRIRVIFDTSAEIRRTLKVIAARRDQNISEVINDLLTAALADELAEDRRHAPGPGAQAEPRGRRQARRQGG